MLITIGIIIKADFKVKKFFLFDLICRNGTDWASAGSPDASNGEFIEKQPGRCNRGAPFRRLIECELPPSTGSVQEFVRRAGPCSRGRCRAI